MCRALHVLTHHHQTLEKGKASHPVKECLMASTWWKENLDIKWRTTTLPNIA
uniref:Uncharacterized protein n=1 Tax=Rhizophora mucronata TaxID=61149 RepID=A0A2P2MKW2_RHIMU